MSGEEKRAPELQHYSLALCQMKWLLWQLYDHQCHEARAISMAGLDADTTHDYTSTAIYHLKYRNFDWLPADIFLPLHPRLSLLYGCGA